MCCCAENQLCSQWARLLTGNDRRQRLFSVWSGGAITPTARRSCVRPGEESLSESADLQRVLNASSAVDGNIRACWYAWASRKEAEILSIHLHVSSVYLHQLCNGAQCGREEAWKRNQPLLEVRYCNVPVPVRIKTHFLSCIFAKRRRRRFGKLRQIEGCWSQRPDSFISSESRLSSNAVLSRVMNTNAGEYTVKWDFWTGFPPQLLRSCQENTTLTETTRGETHQVDGWKLQKEREHFHF